ncbi:MAG: CHAT domain-containing protein [Prochloraceae cyanobacterium]|nr:CHAT domain-containing protein [Prochloraceae cyanobacterium]
MGYNPGIKQDANMGTRNNQNFVQIPLLIKILVLASNPQGTEQLRLDKEIRAIEDAFRSGEKRDRFTVVSKVAVKISDLQSFLRREKPRIVHFCGHGTGSQGLVLTGESREQQTVGTEALADLFRLFATKVECVVLNACYSKVQGEAINQHINYVIGTKRAILDEAAIAFAKGFYEALSDGESIEKAYKFGCNRIQLDIQTKSTSDRKLVPIYSEMEEERIELEEHKVLTLLSKEKLNEIPEEIPDRQLSPHDLHREQVSKGINILADLMQIPSLKNAVIKFKTEFQAILDEVEIISTYKDLHDLLHILEFRCYKSILSEARHFPDDYEICNLELYGQELQDIIADVEGIVVQKNPAAEGITWHQNLDRALEFLYNALEKEDKSQLKKAIWFINRVIASEPSQINRALVSTAKVLRLPTLVDAMSSILALIVDSQLEPAKINQFQDSVSSLSKLNDSLKFLVTTHDRWQRIDSQLRRIETVMANTSDLFELEMSWSDLNGEVAEQCQDSQESWAISLQKEAERLDEAIAAQNTPKVRRYFSSYRNRASQGFYKINQELRNFCGNLREVGNPLAYLLRMME